MNTTRRKIGSMPSRRPSPAQTPPITASPRSRRSGGGVAAALIPVMFAVSAPLAGQPEREQDRADGAEQRGPQVAEAKVEHVDLVEQQQRAERADHEPGRERGGVEVLHAASLHAALASAPGLRSATRLRPKSKLRSKALSTCLPPSQSVKLDRSLTTWISPMPTSPWITRRFTPAPSTGLWRQSTSSPPLS